MARRFVICDVVGTGTKVDPYRPIISDQPVRYVALMPTDAEGKPTRTWCLARVAAVDLSPAISRTGVDPMPNMQPDDLMTSLPAAQRNALLTTLQARGIETPPSWAGVTARQFIRGIGRQLEPAMSEATFEVGD